MIPPLRPPGTSTPSPQPLNERVEPVRPPAEGGVDRPVESTAPAPPADSRGRSQQSGSKDEIKPAKADSGPRQPGLYATLVTTMGSIEFRLLEKEAPLTVRNFVDLCLGRKSWTHPDTLAKSRRPLIPGTTFHRVMPKFMIQAGDPSGTGAGDVGFVIPDEIVPGVKFDRPGRVAMANLGLGTASSQFFITEVPTPWLDGKYTIFGEVTSGQDVVESIAQVPADSATKAPKTAVKIVKVTIKREGPVPPNPPESNVPPKPLPASVPAKKK